MTTTAETMTLTEFLLARIAEDEAAATAVPPLKFDDEPFSQRFTTWESDHTEADDAFLDRNAPARVLAECEAKRRIVELHECRDQEASRPICDTCWTDRFAGYVDYPCSTLRILAAVYADHPDYRSEWKP